MPRFEREVLLQRLLQVHDHTKELLAFMQRDDWTEEALASKAFEPIGECIERLWEAGIGRSARIAWLEALHRAPFLDIAWSEANGEPVPNMDEMTQRFAREFTEKNADRGTLEGTPRPTIEHKIHFVRMAVGALGTDRDALSDAQVAAALDVINFRGGHGRSKWKTLATILTDAGLFHSKSKKLVGADGKPAPNASTLKEEWDAHCAGT